MRVPITLTIDTNLKALCEVQSLNISGFLHEALTAYFSSREEPELKTLGLEIMDLENRLQILKAKETQWISETLQTKIWKSILRKHPAFDNWVKDIKESRRMEDTKTRVEIINKVHDEIAKKTKIPNDKIPSLLHDVISGLTS